MHSNNAKAIAAKNLIDGATVDELREAANDLRALSPESALAGRGQDRTYPGGAERH
jgi:hypothetical protein